MCQWLLVSLGLFAFAGIALDGAPVAAIEPAAPNDRVRLIFDTDMGNDIDDALALGVIHALQSRGECELLAVTLSKDNEFAAPYVDLVNTFYGRSGIPIGVVRAGKTPEDSKYIRIPSEARAENGKQRYPHRLLSGKDAPEAVGLLRQTLAAQPDGSVVIVVVGFSTNLARLLDSKPDAHSLLAGRELVARKCRLLAMMAGMFGGANLQKEYNVFLDLEAAKKVFADWPTPLVSSGFEIGQAIKYPAFSIEHDFRYVAYHPLREAYNLYQKMPYDRETWDLTAVLYAVRPDHGYFGLSQPGTIRVDDKEITRFAPSESGRQRFLTVTPEQIIRVKEALVQLASQPPRAIPAE
jgi:inosine-uridine nucleoside N-ribohydrolase